nr:MAG TPA: 50S ribosomal protein L19 [Caudoviricetes sp.]
MTDYIKRQDAKDLINANFSGLLAAIDAIPAVDVVPVVHARWIARSDKGVISMTHPYMCSRCWRVEMDKEPYCNCGAKMDGGADDDTIGNV